MGSDRYWRRLLRQSTRRPARYIMAAVLTGGVGAAGISTGALADGPCETPDCEQAIGATPSPEEIAFGNKKADLAKRYWEKKLAGEPLGPLADDMKAFAEEIGLPDAFGDISPRSLPYGVTEKEEGITGETGEVTASSHPENLAKDLNVQYEEQDNDYYCGPASAWILNNWNGPHHYGGGTDSYRGEPLTQAYLAIDDYLETDTYGQTLFDRRWERAVDGWFTGGGTSGWYAVAEADQYIHDLDDYIYMLGYDIDYDWPVVFDTHMVSGGEHLAGWPSTSYAWHYVSGNAYYDSGYETGYVDTYDYGSGYKTLGKHTYFSSQTMFNLIHDQGMIW